MKNYIKIWSIVLVFIISITNLSFATPDVLEFTGDTKIEKTSTENENEMEITNESKGAEQSNDKIATDEIINKAEQGVGVAATQVNSLAYTIIEQVSDKSLPICALLILWGAVLYFILGIRNLYKKRQGMLLMWGALTFVVIAKVVNFVFWFAFIRA